MRAVGVRDGGLVEFRTFGAAVAGYMDSIKSRTEQLRESTIEHREEMLVAIEDFFGTDTLIGRVATDDEADRFVRFRAPQVGRAMLRHNLWALQQVLSWSLGQGWISKMPKIEIPSAPPPRQEWLRSHEIEPFLENASEAFRPVAEAAIYYGLREGEVCISQCGDFDVSAGRLWVREKPEFDWKPKGGDPRGVPLVGRGRQIAEQLAKRPQHEWAWPTLDGERRVPGQWFSLATRRAAAGAGITRHLVFHDLRRTFGAMMIEAGASIRAVQVALGHKSVQTTEKVYAPIANRFVAQEMQKMDDLLELRASEHRSANPLPPPRPVARVVK